MHLFVFFCISFCFCLIAVYLFNWRRRHQKPRRHFAKRHITLTQLANTWARKKPDWVKHAVLVLYRETGLSHRKIAHLFNQQYHAQTGYCVGRTFVRQLLMQAEYAAMQRHRQFRHHVPRHVPMLKVWAADTTTVTDTNKKQNSVLGIIDHGARLNVALRFVRRFNGWTFLGCLFLAIGEYGKPVAIKTDNHPVFHSVLVRTALHCCAIQQRFSAPAMPWQNGRIERFFETFKTALQDYVIHDQRQLIASLPAFVFWYNVTRPHQHLEGRTPAQVWAGIDPYRCIPTSVQKFSAWGNKLRGMVLRY